MKAYARALTYEPVAILKKRSCDDRHGGRELPDPSKCALVYNGK